VSGMGPSNRHEFALLTIAYLSLVSISHPQNLCNMHGSTVSLHRSDLLVLLMYFNKV
jgi:hypothetical protein